MQRLDLDDLPPRIARELAALAEGEALLLVQNGLVVGRLTAGARPQSLASAAPAPPPDEAHAAEILEEFRSMMEDDL
jgi:hypothetical protein